MIFVCKTLHFQKQKKKIVRRVALLYIFVMFGLNHDRWIHIPAFAFNPLCCFG